MAVHSAAKLTKIERIVEAVRKGLEGDDSVEFVQQSGYAMTSAGIARHLRSMGGRGHVEELIGAGKTNAEILKTCLPGANLRGAGEAPSSQSESILGPVESPPGPPPKDSPVYATTKLSVRIPSDLYEAIRAAANGERKSQTQLIVDLLTSGLSRMSVEIQDEIDDS